MSTAPARAVPDGPPIPVVAPAPAEFVATEQNAATVNPGPASVTAAAAAGPAALPPTPAVTPSAAPPPPTPARPDLPTSQPGLQRALGIATGHVRTDGTHVVQVALHPADLGAVRIHATLRHGALTITVACADENAQAAVRAALPAMHRELAAADTFDVRLDPTSFGASTTSGGSPDGGSRQWEATGNRPDGGAPNGRSGGYGGRPGGDPSTAGDPGGNADRRPRRGFAASGLDRWM